MREGDFIWWLKWCDFGCALKNRAKKSVAQWFGGMNIHLSHLLWCWKRFCFSKWWSKGGYCWRCRCGPPWVWYTGTCQWRLQSPSNLGTVDWFCFQCLHTDPWNLPCRNVRHHSRWSTELKYQHFVGLGASQSVVAARPWIETDSGAEMWRLGFTKVRSAWLTCKKWHVTQPCEKSGSASQPLTNHDPHSWWRVKNRYDFTCPQSPNNTTPMTNGPWWSFGLDYWFSHLSTSMHPHIC